MENLEKIFNRQGKIDVILDTDTYNEIDDYFAVAYLLSHRERFNVMGITVAPFFNERCTTIADGIEKSEREILRVIELMGAPSYPVLRGGDSYLPSETEGLKSDAADFIIAQAKAHSPENRLYLIAIGAITNVASALVQAPEIAQNIAISWLGGNAFHFPSNDEFNLRQDIAAARVVFNSSAPLIQVPCMGVVSAFTTGKYELEHFLSHKNPLCDYLLARTVTVAEEENKLATWTRVIWDVVAVAALLEDNARFMRISKKNSRLPAYKTFEYTEETKNEILYVDHVHRDGLFYDLFTSLAGNNL